jgi:hypothetical protein
MLLKFDKLDVIDYLILASIKNGVKKYSSIFKNCEKISIGEFREHINELEDMDLITIDSSESWFIRNSNPSIILKKDGIKFVEENISKVQEYWNQKF